ncbi:MAG: LLM class flavin-dependent oxidoreductase, partial [Methylibium sp.]|nr:LLM class flavin-dependent oxidoreductase [Methylibium sp.]
DYLRGRLGPLQAPDDIAARGFGEDEGAAVEAGQRKAFVGTARQVADKLRALAASLELEELVINTWAHAPAVRRHSYALLAKEFGLEESR